MSGERTTLAHYEILDREAAADLARDLERCSESMAGWARSLRSGGRPLTASIRVDMRDVETTMLAYDKAKAALAAVRVALDHPQ